MAKFCSWNERTGSWLAVFCLLVVADSLALFSASLRSQQRCCSAEVVGANGRMGIFRSTRTTAVACPRHVAPGKYTPVGAPIYVATPSDAYFSVYERTLPSRKSDLVFVGNAGVLQGDLFQNCTILVPHFSVLYEDANEQTIQMTTNPELSPPTYVYGKHSSTVRRVLETNGIRTSLVASFAEIQAYSLQKLLWASCLWLLCHEDPTSPITVGEVHDSKQADLDQLVEEILSCHKLLAPSKVKEYLLSYSKSIPDAIPSVALAKAEYHQRNAVWLQGDNDSNNTQTFHIQLLKQQGINVTG